MTGRRHNLFAYGTLQYPDIAEAVAGRRLEGEPAVLHGFARFAIRGAPFPGIIPSPKGAVEGLLYPGVEAPARRRIDAFEGDLYSREPVTVHRRADDIPVAAETFVVRPRWRHTLLHAGWDADAFERDWREAYLREFGGTRRSRQR